MSGDDPDQLDKLWEQLALQQRDIFDNLLSKNFSLEAENKELRVESGVRKNALEGAMERNKELEEKIEALSASLENMKRELALQQFQQFQLTDVQHGDPSALVLIDGDGYIFSPGYWRQGKEGGRRAAVVLHDILATAAGLRSQLYAIIYFNRRGLGNALCANNICLKDQFEDFIVGFNQSTPLFAMIDAGHGKEAADAKIRGTLRFFSRLTQIQLILFGGGHDRGYLTELSALRTEGLLHKLALLKGSKRLAHGFESLAIPIIPIEGLFLETNLSQVHNATPTKRQPSHRASLSLSSTGTPTSDTLCSSDPISIVVSEHGNPTDSTKLVLVLHNMSVSDTWLPELYASITESPKAMQVRTWRHAHGNRTGPVQASFTVQAIPTPWILRRHILPLWTCLGLRELRHWSRPSFGITVTVQDTGSQGGQSSVARTGPTTPSSDSDLSCFVPLIDALVRLKELGQEKPIRSVVVEKIGTKRILELYKKAGVNSFKAYAELAADTGLVVNLFDRIALVGN
ncbi:uncharacterized protein EI90DRAFT_3119649 [Cantharellus anzutake]|uniref:uncharacterized protein n=1 Tax=Cantharellus anzutake TaxID=1750568 RepID=UPI0019060452|nr:uncharacterized protein EI90DRAFT_3119649 [Cantharellus anzutake]KAF8336369.1 hypothetical protein EI90DRAFT_3119649 [Cantharellus anzutake]